MTTNATSQSKNTALDLRKYCSVRAGKLYTITTDHQKGTEVSKRDLTALCRVCQVKTWRVRYGLLATCEVLAAPVLPTSRRAIVKLLTLDFRNNCSVRSSKLYIITTDHQKGTGLAYIILKSWHRDILCIKGPAFQFPPDACAMPLALLHHQCDQS